ncbi:uncharacterized protein LOC124815321 [Hydra vulgaris]|uniref:uncharacterized protein LOC124815321 n=1 Tax=Hydra vulgaris TaxID=6087 RepID=UPI001F5F1917|nr:uncharacterized protein LOC124815321 [Hydra vulgaris]XP_047139880.1 uncharacterized protein LOC124815321 [Hydra vulgaris]
MAEGKDTSVKRFNELVNVFNKYTILFESNANRSKLKRCFDDEPAIFSKVEAYDKTRFYDSLARIIDAQGKCTSVYIIGCILNISFNSKAEKEARNKVNILVKLLNDNKRNEENKAAIRILALRNSLEFFNAYKTFLKKYEKCPHEKYSVLFYKLKIYFQQISQLKFNKSILQKLETLDDPFEMFYPTDKFIEQKIKKCDLIKQTNEDDPINSSYVAFIKYWYRVIQDVEKVLIVFKKYNYELTPEFNANPDNYHAEIALVKYLRAKKQESIGYIGISKLCCKLCNTTLDLLNIQHAGSHNILYAGANWIIPYGNMLNESHVQVLIDVIKHYFQKNINMFYSDIIRDTELSCFNVDDNMEYLNQLESIFEKKEHVDIDHEKRNQVADISNDDIEVDISFFHDEKLLSLSELKTDLQSVEILTKTM